ncbi:MAG: hypothetical protein AB7F78_15175 [Hyphomicrobiaceae bacterium]
MLRIVSIAVLGVVACGHANATGRTMPINFIGEWCYSAQEKGSTSYLLPSWTDGRCTRILSVHPYGFSDGSRHCEPVKIRQSSNTAPSGISHIATISARCQSNGPATSGKLRTFEFVRYKGSLSVSAK